MRGLHNNRSLKEFRRKLRNNLTKTEELLWREIKGNQLGIKFRRQFTIGNYIADFCSPKHRIVVEVDGITHEDDEVRRKDIKRDQFLSELGYAVIRIPTEDIIHDLDNVVRSLYIMIHGED